MSNKIISEFAKAHKMQVAADARVYLKEFNEPELSKALKLSHRYAAHAKRKTIQKADVQLAGKFISRAKKAPKAPEDVPEVAEIAEDAPLLPKKAPKKSKAPAKKPIKPKKKIDDDNE